MTLPDDNTARLGFFEAFASAEIFVPLAGEDEGTITPQIFETTDGTFALGFEAEEGLADFTGGGAYAALPGRVIAALLADQNVGLCLNPDGEAALLAGDDLRWLTRALTRRPAAANLGVGRIGPAPEVPTTLVAFIEKRLEVAWGLVKTVVISTHDDGTGPAPVIALIGVAEGAGDALIASMQEALTFADAGPGWQIACLGADTQKARQFRELGLSLRPREPEPPAAPSAPGSDPDRPPILT